MNNEKKFPTSVVLGLILGEAAVSLIVTGIFWLLGKFTLSVVWGALLGSAVVVLNFVFLSLSVNRAIDKVMAEMPAEEMDEEMAAEFAEKHAMSIQNAAKLSVIVRMASMLAVLVIAFILEWFNVISTLVPLLMFKPILMLDQYIKGRRMR